MHICHVNLASGFHGGENQTLALITEQLRLGYQLTVVANPKSPFAQSIRELGCHLVLAKHFTAQHKRSITRGCQAIHVHEGRALYWAMIQSKRTGTPYVVTRRIDNPLKDRWLLKQGYRRAAALVGISSEIVHQIQLKLPKCQPSLIPSSPVSYPCNAEDITAIRAKFSGKFLVIHAAKMLKHKGFDVTIEAARALAQSHPDIHIALLGDGKERAELEALATGLTNVSFEGRQSHMGNWFAAADLQVHPSYTEGLGSVILEGMQAGLCVVATRTGGIPDIIQNRINGVLIPVGDAKALADTIADLAQQPEQLARLRLAAQSSLAHFAISHTAQQYQAIYQSITQPMHLSNQ